MHGSHHLGTARWSLNGVTVRWASLRWLHLPGSFGFNMSSAKHLFLGSTVYVHGRGKQVPSFSRVDWDGKATGSDLGVVALLDYAIYRQGEC